MSSHTQIQQLIRNLETTRDETLKYFSLGEDGLARTYATLDQIKTALLGRPQASA